MSCLLLLGLGYVYAYVPAHYADEYELYAEIDEVDFGAGLEAEAALLGEGEVFETAEDYTASAFDALIY